jgi:hypothetical protein
MPLGEKKVENFSACPQIPWRAGEFARRLEDDLAAPLGVFVSIRLPCASDSADVGSLEEQVVSVHSFRNKWCQLETSGVSSFFSLREQVVSVRFLRCEKKN